MNKKERFYGKKRLIDRKIEGQKDRQIVIQKDRWKDIQIDKDIGR